jgi:membrane protease YdiL (CAAX protease family)
MVGSGVAVVYTWSAFRNARSALRLGPTGTRLFIILLFALGMAMVIDLIDLGITGVFEPVPELLSVMTSDRSIVVWVTAVLWMLIAQPAAEELIFRGVLFPSLRQLFGGWGGLLANALLYGLFHLIAYTAEPGHLWHTFATPLLIGLVIVGVRASTHSTRAALVAHVGFGIFALLKLLAVG